MQRGVLERVWSMPCLLGYVVDRVVTSVSSLSVPLEIESLEIEPLEIESLEIEWLEIEWLEIEWLEIEWLEVK